LKLKYDKLLSNFAFNFQLCRYTKAVGVAAAPIIAFLALKMSKK